MNNLPTVILRAVEPEDLDFLYKIENDPDLWDVTNSNTFYSHYVLHDYVAHNNYDIYKDGQIRWMIENNDGKTVGIIDLTNFEPRHERAEVGVVIEKKHRGKRYAMAAMYELIKYTHEILHLHQLYSIINIDNKNSIAIHESVGFKKGALLKDWIWQHNGYIDSYVMQLFLKKDE